MRTVAFVGFPSSIALNRLRSMCKLDSADYRFVLFTERKKLSDSLKKKAVFFDTVFTIKDDRDIKKVIDEIGGDLEAITARTDGSIPLFARIIPHLPDHVLAPDPESLVRSVQKTHMRQAFIEHDRSITPLFTRIHKGGDLESDIKDLSFPLIIKPSGLSASKLVQKVSTPKELKKQVTAIFNRLEDVYGEERGRGKPEILIEEFIEGDVYSTDVYVDADGECTFCPFVGYINKSPGHQSFAPHVRFAPVSLSEDDIAEAHKVSRSGIKALGLRNVTTHTELIRSNDGWKVVEIGPRTGGNRDKIYSYAFGFNHTANDLYNRMHDKEVQVQHESQAHVAVVFLYPQDEGRVVSVKGFDEIKKLSSYKAGWQSVEEGDNVMFVEHGGKYGAKATFVSDDRDVLENDIKRAKELFVVEVE